MTTTKPDEEYFGSFDGMFRIHVHQLLAWGHQDAQPHIQSDNEQEPSITGYIDDAMQNRLRALDCPDWCEHYFVTDERPIKKKGRRGKTRPRADMVIEANFQGRPQTVCEAKRLRRKGYGVKKYIAADGMGCFVDGVYAARYDEAIMLGYVQSDSLEYWQREVMRSIDMHKDTLYLIPPQKEEMVIAYFPLEWMSIHARKCVGRDIIILHILLDFRTIDDA